MQQNFDPFFECVSVGSGGADTETGGADTVALFLSGSGARESVAEGGIMS